MGTREKQAHDWSRRNFLQVAGASAPTLKLLLDATSAGGEATGSNPGYDSHKFTPVDLSPFFNSSPADFGSRQQAKKLSGECSLDGLVHTPGGEQTLQGIPFLLGQQSGKCWVVLSTHEAATMANHIEIPFGGPAGFFCLAAFCDWDKNESPPPGEDSAEQVGQRLAELVFVYDDGSERVLSIRRRFEVGAPSIPWGHLCFAAEPHTPHAPRKLTDPLSRGTDWGTLQMADFDNHYPSGPDRRAIPLMWISALQNPMPDKMVKAARLRATSEEPLVVCGLTAFHGQENPLRYERLCLYRITLPEPAAEDLERWAVNIDLGIVARVYPLPEFESETWLRDVSAGLGESSKPIRNGRYLYLEVTANPEATLVLTDRKSGKQYEFDLGQAAPGKELEAHIPGARIEMLEPAKVWLHAKVLDTKTGRPTPVRVAFRSKEGRYIPPYGHRTEINDAWFQDYGADVKLMDTSFAYVDGTFQVELPVGEVYVEMTKGFEYAPVRKKLTIQPGQQELNLEISRFTDHRAQGWVTADTHVHFLSPSTAILEGQAEGLNLISLLAAQWGDLFTNVGDISHGPLVSRDGETMVQVSSENRQHLLGHLGLVGGLGAPAFPMSASGPEESYLGGPLWTSLADWADEQRKRQGLVVAVHFPYPTAELAADIALGKIDAVELFPYGEHFNTLRFLDWYRYLNCGYRLPAVGGTDKMGAYMPVGANRTYAHLGQEEFSFANWAKAVRRGNTFMTTGPLLIFQADGHKPGEEITLGAGGGTVEVNVRAESFVPFHLLEVVMNGKVVASREERAGTREMSFSEKVHVPGAAWLAARCASRLGPTTAWELGIQAHTSPVYVRVPGQELFSAPATAYMLTLIEGAEMWAENLAIRPDAERLARVRKVFQDAREQLHRRLHEHGISQ